MPDQAREIVWRLRLRAPPGEVFALLSTDEGRASFWAERTEQQGETLIFHFPGGEILESRMFDVRSPERVSFSYFDDSTVTFELRSAGTGTDLRLRETGVPRATAHENEAGWVSVLMSLKAQADYQVDLRNHDPRYAWANGYVDN